jgi:hypothetical protein
MAQASLGAEGRPVHRPPFLGPQEVAHAVGDQVSALVAPGRKPPERLRISNVGYERMS